MAAGRGGSVRVPAVSGVRVCRAIMTKIAVPPLPAVLRLTRNVSGMAGSGSVRAGVGSRPILPTVPEPRLKCRLPAGRSHGTRTMTGIA